MLLVGIRDIKKFLEKFTSKPLLYYLVPFTFSSTHEYL